MWYEGRPTIKYGDVLTFGACSIFASKHSKARASERASERTENFISHLNVVAAADSQHSKHQVVYLPHVSRMMSEKQTATLREAPDREAFINYAVFYNQ